MPKRDLHYFWASEQHCAACFSLFKVRQNRVFSLRLAPIVHSLLFLTKVIIILMAPRDLNAFLTLCMQLRPRLNFLDLILVQKSVDQLTIAKSYKDIAELIFAIQ